MNLNSLLWEMLSESNLRKKVFICPNWYPFVSLIMFSSPFTLPSSRSSMSSFSSSSPSLAPPPLPPPSLFSFLSSSSSLTSFISFSSLSSPHSPSQQEYYDYDHNLFRLDVYYDGSRGGTEGPYTVIENFDIEVRYIINRRLSNCSIFALSSNLSLFESEVGESGNLQLKSPRDLLFLSNDFNYSYEGVTTVRGVEVDVWISLRDSVELGGANLSNAVIEWYFTRPGWELETDISKTTDPTPWRLKLSGIISYINSSTNALVTEDFNKEYDIIGFSTIEPSFDAFDTSICISPENYHILTMVVPGHEAGVTDLGQFRRSIRTAITEFAGINPLQVGSIEVSELLSQQCCGQII